VPMHNAFVINLFVMVITIAGIILMKLHLHAVSNTIDLHNFYFNHFQAANTFLSIVIRIQNVFLRNLYAMVIMIVWIRQMRVLH